ncbi:MAG: hypothetical protein GXO42_00810 [bacterium]|nr:hypothetical protein [bacterium]
MQATVKAVLRLENLLLNMVEQKIKEIAEKGFVLSSIKRLYERSKKKPAITGEQLYIILRLEADIARRASRKAGDLGLLLQEILREHGFVLLLAFCRKELQGFYRLALRLAPEEWQFLANLQSVVLRCRQLQAIRASSPADEFSVLCLRLYYFVSEFRELLSRHYRHLQSPELKELCCEVRAVLQDILRELLRGGCPLPELVKKLQELVT